MAASAESGPTQSLGSEGGDSRREEHLGGRRWRSAGTQSVRSVHQSADLPTSSLPRSGEHFSSVTLPEELIEALSENGKGL